MALFKRSKQNEPPNMERQPGMIEGHLTGGNGMRIIEFLTARITEDEALAQAAAESATPAMDTSHEPVGPAWQDDDGMVLGKPDKDGYPIPLWDNEGAWTLSMDSAASAHVARHDPARVLAECAAKRVLVEDWKRVTVEHRRAYLSDPPLAPVVAAFAAVYKDHPDYQQEWDDI